MDASGKPVANQFSEPLGGVGGTLNAAGFYLRSLTLPTAEGEPIRFLNAPVLVVDVTAQDPKTLKSVTLDGDLGMNFLVAGLDLTGLFSPAAATTGSAASSSVKASLAPAAASAPIDAPAFDWITFDQPGGLPGLDVPGVVTSPTPSPTPGPTPSPTPTATIGGTVYADANGDGSFGAGDGALSGWQVYLDNDNSGTLTAGDTPTTTKSDGSYQFTGLVANQQYVVREATPAGWRLTEPTGKGSYPVTPTAGQTVSGDDFGNLQLGRVTGTIYNDANASGGRGTSAAEPGLSGWTVWLDANTDGRFDAGDLTAITDSTGGYAFDGIDPGRYGVYLQSQKGWRQTQTGGTGGSYQATVTGGQTASGRDFGVTHKALLSGNVFKDANGNRKQDKGEAGLSGFRVYIDANGDGKWDNNEVYTRSDASGFWSLALDAKTYSVKVEPLKGYKTTTPTSGKYSVTLAAGQVLGGKTYGEKV